MLANVHIWYVYIAGKVFPILSISLLYPKESFSSLIPKQLGRKDSSMEQLPIDSYMLLCKQKNSISVNQKILSFSFDSNLYKKS